MSRFLGKFKEIESESAGGLRCWARRSKRKCRVTANRQGVSFESNENALKLIVLMVIQL
jgi:hypothetical protein